MLDDLYRNYPAHRSDIPVAAALRALPLQAPARPAWPALAAALAKRERQRRRHWPWALAASLALAVVLAGLLRTAPEQANADTASAADPLPQLLAQSAQLEALISASSDISTSAPLMSLSTDLEDQLAVIDSQLGNVALNPDARRPLWQQRVQVLRELAGLQATEQWLATRGEQSSADALVYAY